MKNILVISGSSRKNGNCMKLVTILTEQLKEDTYDIEIANLTDYKIEFCRGCTTCFKKHESACPLKDDIQLIAEKMKNADGIIFTSPVYGRMISGQLKTLMDRLAYTYHRACMVAKPVVILSSADIGYLNEINKFMTFIFTTMGMTVIGSIGAISAGLKGIDSYQNKIAEKIEKLADAFEKELNRAHLPNPRFVDIVHFIKWRTKAKLHKDLYKYDYAYWLEKGWLDADYYYETKIPIRFKILSKLLSKLLQKFVAKRSMYYK